MERKRFMSINGSLFMRMVAAGRDNLTAQVKQINALNVFPVPDGDTGTNMGMTLQSGVAELMKKPDAHLGKAAETLSRGLLMGARGNSGVILSQLFRGFAKYVQDHSEIDAERFAEALQSGVNTAYKAVVKPVEGTILTVAKEAARGAVRYARKGLSLNELMQYVIEVGQEALDRTPDFLPVLKQVGVVDAGGKGLMVIYEGFMATLEGGAAYHQNAAQTKADEVDIVEHIPLAVQAHQMTPVQAQLSADSIEYGYCTEFLLSLEAEKLQKHQFEETQFRQEMGAFGDSLLVVADHDLVKVHIHAEFPGSVMNAAMKYGALTGIKIENMRDQHEQIVHDEATVQAEELSAVQSKVPVEQQESVPERASMPDDSSQAYGFVAVAAGDGLAEIFKSLGSVKVVSGGQTMNPSTEDITEAIRQVPAQTVFVLPNNSNIIMAASQAAEWIEDKQVIVIPSKTIPQGLSAMLAFSESASAEDNATEMNEALTQVHTGQVTYAVRDTVLDQIEIKKDDFIGILDNEIIVSAEQMAQACQSLMERMIDEGGEIITIYTGEEALEPTTAGLISWLEEHHPDIEVEVHDGGQPVYAYIFSVE